MSKSVDWSDPRTVLFSTPHGSRLYGLAHANSDNDTFVVHPSSARRARQTIVGSEDLMRMNFEYFLQHAAVGSHQSLEAMFSRQATVDHFRELREGFFATGPEVIERYLRTAKKFATSDSFKKRRHALRLLLNLRDITRYGRFDPTLSAKQVELISDVAHEGEFPSERYLELFRELAPREVHFDFEDEAH